MLEIRDVLGEQQKQEQKEKWLQVVWLGRRFAPLTDEEREDFKWLLGDGAIQASSEATVEEAKEKAGEILQRFQRHGAKKMGPEDLVNETV